MKGLWQTDYVFTYTSLPNLSIIPSPSVAMTMISFRINLKYPYLSVTNLRKLSAFWVLQTLIIPRARVIKSVLKRSTFTVIIIPQVSLVPPVHLSKSQGEPILSFLQFLKIHYSIFFCNLPEFLHLCMDGRMRSMSYLVFLLHGVPDEAACRNLVER